MTADNEAVNATVEAAARAVLRIENSVTGWLLPPDGDPEELQP